jgi:hypothetical protein
MHFDQTTLNILMDVVEDAGLKEADYVKACNALKHLHNMINRGGPPHTPAPYRLQSELNAFRTAMSRTESVIRRYEYGILNADPAYVRTVNKHRQQVIVELMPDVLGSRRTRVMKTDEINRHTQTLIERGLLTGPDDMKGRADVKKVRECEAVRSTFRNRAQEERGRYAALRERFEALLQAA